MRRLSTKMDSIKNVLVTGGAGFIGSVLVDELVKRRFNVFVIDNLQAGKIENLRNSIEKIHFIQDSVNNTNVIDKMIRKIDIIFNIAANANVPYSIEDFKYDLKTNALGPLTILKEILRQKVPIKYFIQASSAAVYGEPKYTPIDENHPLNPISPYGISKLTAEKYLDYFYKEYGLPIVIFRIFNTYGIRQPRYVIFDLLRKLYTNPHLLEVLGTGEQIRDYCYIKDTVNSLISGLSEVAIGEKFNIAGGTPIKLKELVELILKLLDLGGNTEVIYTGKSWKGDIQKLVANISKIKKILNFKPNYNLTQGLKEMINWFNQLPEELKIFNGIS